VHRQRRRTNGQQKQLQFQETDKFLAEKCGTFINKVTVGAAEGAKIKSSSKFGPKFLH